MSQSRRINELADIIAKNTAIVDAFLESKNLPTPTLGVDALPRLPIPEENADVEEARLAVVEASTEMKALMTGPSMLLRPEYTNLVSLKAIARFNIDRAFPVGQEITYGKLAEATGLNEKNLRRVIRHAITDHIFCEPRKGVVAHSGLSKLLVEDDAVHAYVANSLNEWWPAASRGIEAWEKWPGSEEPNQTGFSFANNTSQGVFEFFENDPVRARGFAQAMSSVNSNKGSDPHFLLDGYPWGSLGHGLIVDVGGSEGTVSIEIARRFPDIKCIVQDLPATVEKGKSALPQDVSDRVSFMAHDFFTDQPVTADLYLFRSIFHNWSDKYGIKILRSLVPAMKPKARIILYEVVMPPPGVLRPSEERRARHLDIAMWQLFNAYQRDEDEWQDLLRRADPRFKFKGQSRPKGATQSIIVVEWEESHSA